MDISVMPTHLWFLFLGLLLLFVGLASFWIRKAPLTSAMVYLTLGLILGPSGLQWFHFNPLRQAGLLEVITEVAVLISLFAAGVKMPVPVSFKQWKAPLSLAFVAMALTVGLIAAFGYFALALPLGAAVLLGAVLAPTDPVLATDVQIREPGDEDQLRFTLTSEAGLNDGTAFPFVMLGLGLLGLHDLGDAFSRWLLLDLLWATLAAIGIGSVLGYAVANFARYFRVQGSALGLQHDFIGLGLIGLVYGLCEIANAWGFLGVFAAAVALRQAEVSQSPAMLDERLQESAAETHPHIHYVSEASLVFKEHLERLSEVVLVILLGGTLFWDSWSWQALSLSVFLFFLARPLAVFISLSWCGASRSLSMLSGWFGVRGIGSLYYLMYAIEHGLPEPLALQLIHYTLVVVALSIFIHGISVKPMLKKYW